MVRTYESIFIIKPELGEDKIKEKIEEVEECIKKYEGLILKVENWGKKRLAYRIQKVRNGIYIFIQYKILPQMILKIEEMAKLKENIIKFTTINVDETPAELLQAEVKTEVKTEVTTEVETGKTVEKELSCKKE